MLQSAATGWKRGSGEGLKVCFNDYIVITYIYIYILRPAIFRNKVVLVGNMSLSSRTKELLGMIIEAAVVS